uniref:Oligopeptide transporter n=1 Tax=Musa acuminata subsp. malaccensis TaxID=214687 RepID=A0A804HND5_MUSAM
MWWPSTLVDVSFYRALHEPEKRAKGKLSRCQFFVVVIVATFTYSIVPVYLFPSITALSFVCWIWKDSITAQQIGSGFNGLGIGSFALDWITMSSYMDSPLAVPAFVVVNMMAGFILILYVLIPLSYWNNAYDAKRFPIFSSSIFDIDGQFYNVSRVLDDKSLTFNEEAYNNYSKLYFSASLMYSYGFTLASFTSSISHVALFYGSSLLVLATICRFISASNARFLLACALVFIFLLPEGVMMATTSSEFSINLLLEIIIGYLQSGKPIANIAFTTYGSTAINTAKYFTMDMKRAYYMKIPPKVMFLIQILGNILACVVSFSVGWWVLHSVKNICYPELLPKGSPWTCPWERRSFAIGVTWGVIGPIRMFYPHGTYSIIFIFIIIGLLAPVGVWMLSRVYPEKTWIKLIN